MPHVFGLTGGIGTGKSTVLRRFVERGLPVVNADELARVVVAPGSEALQELVREFGPQVLGADGAMDRRYVAEHVFSDLDARRRLEAITHPRISREAHARFEALGERGEPLACYEVPLLFEVGLDDSFRPIVVVSAPESLQIARAAARDASDDRRIRARIAAQLPLATKTARADYVIDNSGSLADTLRQADAVLDAICRKLSIDPRRYPMP